MDCQLHASDVSHMMPKLPNCEFTPQPNLEKLHVGHPVLSLHNGDVVYLMAKVEHRDYKAWIIPIDLRNKVIQEPADFAGADRTVGITFTYMHTGISSYPQNAPAEAAGIVEQEEVRNFLYDISGAASASRARWAKATGCRRREHGN
ncbi:hypothetical protein E2562_022197 [Oryza meyeriana var. granulata]|uniref:Uncharacterized protein n=1 Tax=Oryza meyeriana var. granulata TaxID=110450 RepID=A0A6G1DLQ2_9ORYZ|nr:hypothetical protein E2562_022197 [Oryza meyeriana var. granulata]